MQLSQLPESDLLIHAGHDFCLLCVRAKANSVEKVGEDVHCGMTTKGKWEWDALRPGIRLFLESYPQKVADLGSDFGLIMLQNTLA